MDSDVKLLHQQLDELFIFAEAILAKVKLIYKQEVSYGFYKGHYIKLGNEQVYQRYPLPVITIKGMGDIGVNLDTVWLEYFIDRSSFYKVNLEKLVNDYHIEVYGGEDCSLDFYYIGDHKEDILGRIDQSNQRTIGIAVYLNKENIDVILEKFLSIHNELCKT